MSVFIDDQAIDDDADATEEDEPVQESENSADRAFIDDEVQPSGSPCPLPLCTDSDTDASQEVRISSLCFLLSSFSSLF